MAEDQNFDPYIDWDGMTDEMVADLHDLIVPYKEASERFAKKGRREDAIRVLQFQGELAALHEAIMRTLWTVPAMVHVAGPKTVEAHEDHTHTVQRCKRCGSLLQMWREGTAVLTPEGTHELEEDDITWWTEGDQIAKSSDESEHRVQLYVIDDRDLEKHEMLCPDLASQFG